MRFLIKNIVIVFFLLSIVTVNSFAENYINDAKRFYEKRNYKAAIIQLKNQLKENHKDLEARLLLGKSYLKIGNINKADKEITRVFKKDPSNEEIILSYAQLLVTKREYHKATEILDKKFVNIENDTQRQMYMAYALLGQNQLAEAGLIFSRLAEQYNDVESYIGLAQIAIAEKKIEKAAQWIEQSLKIEPDNINALKTKAVIKIADSNYEEALDIYNLLIQKQNDNLSLYLKRAAVLLQLQNLDDAEKDIKKIRDKIKNHPQANYLLSQIKLRQKNYKEASAAAQDVLFIVPNHQNSMLVLGVATFFLGNYNQTDKYLTQYLSSNPDNIAVLNMLANVYLAKSEGDQALLILEGIDEEKRNKNAGILTTMGSAYLIAGEHQKGIDALNKAAKLDPKNKLIQKKLINGQLGTGDVDSAISGMEKIVDSEPSNQKARFLLIVAYIQKNKLQKAKSMLNESIQQTQDNPVTYNLLGVVEKLIGNDQESKKAYEQAIRLNRNYISAYMGLAALFSKEKNWESAKTYYTYVTHINPRYIKAYLYLAAIAEKQDLQQEMEKLLKIALEHSKGSIASQVIVAKYLSKLYIKQKTPEKIIPIAEEFNRNYSENIKVQSFLAATQIVNKENKKAEQTLKSIISKKTSDVKYRILLANLLAEQKNRENEVIELLDSVIKIIPDDSKIVMLKASYLLKNKMYQQAIKFADDIQRQFPKLALGALVKGDSYRYEKKLDKALAQYQKAYQLQANHKTLFIMSDIMRYQGKEKDALKLLEGELTSNDKDLPILFKIANIYQFDKQYNQAILFYTKMLEIKPDNLLALNNLAWVYAQENNPKALIVAKKAYEQAPDSALILDTYGYILLKQGDKKVAIKLLEKAANLSPQTYDIQYHLAEAYYLSGKEEKAKKLITPLLSDAIKFSEKENAKLLFNKL